MHSNITYVLVWQSHVRLASIRDDTRVFVSNIKRVTVCISMSKRDVVLSRLAMEHDGAKIRSLAGEERQGAGGEGGGGGGGEEERETKEVES